MTSRLYVSNLVPLSSTDGLLREKLNLDFSLFLSIGSLTSAVVSVQENDDTSSVCGGYEYQQKDTVTLESLLQSYCQILVGWSVSHLKTASTNCQ